MKSSLVIKAGLILSIVVMTVTGAYAQETKAQKKAEAAAKIKSLIEARKYVFVAQSALPMSGRVRQITPDYHLTVTADSIVSYLPYFGRAFTAVYGATKSPLDFKTKSFDYTNTPRKKGGWEIAIKPKDQDVQSMNLTVFDDGYGSLQVTSNSRQPISFNGYIQEIKERKKKR
ncbi:MAG TPA: DUF4251 domain-containing protein [Chitinophaga sp.]|uniref:DUF4251 domain-containing protein n=1 Tax=Chitinophaga sp. TaxID=1869181 RepID=UPI002D121D61|nr:DUF4251 domain-containing protein [Chitinophaga sp.]HVI46453.1 DUF4251 domain-containing protein [Chitinophaga sp.]